MDTGISHLLSTASVAAFTAPLAAGDTGETWRLLVPAGSFKARDGRGPFKSGSRSEMEAIVARSKQYHGSTDIVVDYDHQSVFGAKDGVGGTAKAAGWVKELQVRDDGIYGRIEWTAAASAAIKAGEYRYLSPVIPHRKSNGEIIMILNVALTNTPAVHLEAMSATKFFDNLNKEPDMDKILAALGLAAGSDENAVLAAINAHLAVTTAIAKAAGLKDDAEPADVLAAALSAIADRKTIVEAAGQKPDAKTDEVIAALKAQSTGSAANPDPAKFVPIEAVTQLQADFKALRDETTADKAEDVVAAAMKAGKLTPALKDWGVALFKSDKAAFEQFVGGAPALTEGQLKTPKKPGAATAALTAEQAAAAKVLGIPEKDYLATLNAERGEAEETA